MRSGASEAVARTRPGGGNDLVDQVRSRLDELARVPRPGRRARGTWARWSFLADVAAGDLSTARLVEGHLDALAIAAELGTPAAIPKDRLSGVWAARPGDLEARPVPGGWVLTGTKPWCSGSVDLDVALVTAVAPDGPRLFALDPGGPGVSVVLGTWTPLGMAATKSFTLAFDSVLVASDAALGGPGAYVDRPGFGHGGCGVAACWWGGAMPLLARLREALTAKPSSDDLARAVGAAGNAMHAARLVLVDAADTIDRHPDDRPRADHLALRVRSTVEAGARFVLDAANRHLGAGPLSHEPDHSSRVADLLVYLSQHHPAAVADLGRADAAGEPRGVGE